MIVSLLSSLAFIDRVVFALTLALILLTLANVEAKDNSMASPAS